MTRSFTFAISWLLIGCACGSQSAWPDDSSHLAPPSTGPADGDTDPIQMSTTMRIRVGSKVFSATLEDNETASAFKAMLPLTLKMADLNANEKYSDLPGNLPVDASNPRTIHAGDVMLYGASTIVLFYETFTTSYRYTRLGTIDDASGLEAALGAGSRTVTFEL